jgi:hypothetical protein
VSRFKPAAVQTILHQVLQEKLVGRQYNEEDSPYLTREIADDIRSKLKGKL